MPEHLNPQATSNIPTFNFSLTDFCPGEAPILFPQLRKREKRKPGLITNIRKSAVSHILEVFRSNTEPNQEVFNVKKKLVVNAIEAMYENKKALQKYEGYAPKQNQQKKYICQKQFERSGYLYYTPSKSVKTEIRESTVSTKRSSSQSKLNYSRSEYKFNEQEISKFRKRAGCNR